MSIASVPRSASSLVHSTATLHMVMFVFEFSFKPAVPDYSPVFSVIPFTTRLHLRITPFSPTRPGPHILIGLEITSSSTPLASYVPTFSSTMSLGCAAYSSLDCSTGEFLHFMPYNFGSDASVFVPFPMTFLTRLAAIIRSFAPATAQQLLVFT